MVKEKLVQFSENKTFKKIRRKVIVFRSFMSRSYAWIQSPGFVMILVGVLYPYIKPYIDINIWVLAIIIFIAMMIIGFLERYLGFFTEEARYNLERNTLMLGKLNDLNKKVDELNKRLGDGKKEINKETD